MNKDKILSSKEIEDLALTSLNIARSAVIRSDLKSHLECEFSNRAEVTAIIASKILEYFLANQKNT